MEEADAVGRRLAAVSPIGTPATEVEQDFLKILMREIGNSYRVVVVQHEFEAELPVDQDANDGTGGLFGAEFDASLTMRDVILVKRGSKVKLGKTRRGPLHDPLRAQRRRTAHPGRPRLGVGRGEAGQEALPLRRHPPRGVRRSGDPRGPGEGAHERPAEDVAQVILVGDLNSGIGRHNEPEQPGDDLAFRALAGFGMKDNGAVQSCCYSDLFDPAATFDHTVDHVLTKPGLRRCARS